MENLTNNFDIAGFQNEVLREIAKVEEFSTNDFPRNLSSAFYETNSRSEAFSLTSPRRQIYDEIKWELRKPLFLISKDRLNHLIDKLRDEDEVLLENINQQYQRHLSRLEHRLAEVYEREKWHGNQNENAKEEATKILLRKDVRNYLCPILQSVSNDVNDIAKSVTPILIPLILTGTLAIPLQPLLFAYIAIIIARMGVASLCENYKDKDKDKK